MSMSKKTKRTIYNILIVFLVAVFVFCVWKIASYYIQANKSKQLNNSIAEEFVSYEDSSPNEDNSSSQPSDEAPASKEYYHAPIPSSVNFEKLIAQNSDVVGWVFNQNGVINYPILQGEDNWYYLDKLIDGRTNANGSIFMEALNKRDFSDRNTIIYGHSMKTGVMFGTLLRYRNQSYFDAYPSFYVYTPQQNYRVDIFAAYESSDTDPVFSLLSSQSEFDEFINYAYSKSKIRSDVRIGADDNIVSFATCAYSFDNARFIVCGKLVEIN